MLYSERLKSLNLPSLEYRCKSGDMIFTYQLLHNQFDMDTFTLLHPVTYNSTRGHNFKLCKPFSSIISRRNCFSVRVIDNWNNLPCQVVNSESPHTFKNIITGMIIYLIVCKFTKCTHSCRIHRHCLYDNRACMQLWQYRTE